MPKPQRKGFLLRNPSGRLSVLGAGIDSELDNFAKIEQNRRRIANAID